MNSANSDLKILIERFRGHQAVTRFAPSPTGFLHEGHVVHALYVWGIAGLLGADVILRIENHDLGRCKPEYEKALLEDLDRLGFAPDMGKTAEFRHGSCQYRQSDRSPVYQKYLELLKTKGLVYACDCSRKTIRARTSQDDDQELRYDDHCRERGLPLNGGYSLRVILPARKDISDDILLGFKGDEAAYPCGDPVIREANGNWSYQFAVVCDDHEMGINLVIRGRDILSSTGRQLLLAEAMNMDFRPVYFHHPLITDAGGRKLSKSDFDADIHTMFREGAAAEDIIGEAARRAGLIDVFRPVTAGSVEDLFRKWLNQ